MDLVNILTPSLAAFAALVVIGLGIQAFRQGRHIRRLEQRLNDMGAAGTSAPLERLTQLQQRMAVGSGTSGASDAVRRAATVAAVVVGVAVVAGAGWWFLLRDGGGGGGTSTTAQTATTTGPAGTTTTAVVAAPGTCTKVTPLSNPAGVTVTVFNASGISGAVANRVWPELRAAGGYSQGSVTNEPNAVNDLAKTSVQYVRDRDRNAACVVARDINVKRVIRLDGYNVDQIGGDAVNVVVVVGQDVASR